MQFKSIPGRRSIKSRLIQSIEEGKIPHAQLFAGPEGSGSLAMAIAYTQYLFCKNRNQNDSCGECSSCQKIQKQIHPDLHFSFPFASGKKEDISNLFLQEWRSIIHKNPFFSLEDWIHELALENKMVNIPISECRQILRELSLKPYEGDYQILILWLPEFLRESANSLLKMIEEPSPGTIFLLVTENKDLLLPTLLSRTQQIYIEAPNHLEVETYLMENYSLEKNSAQTIAFLSEGNLSKAFGMMNGAVDQFQETFQDWVKIMREGNPHKIVEWVEGFNGKSSKTVLSKEDKKNFLLYGIKMFRAQFMKSYGQLETSPKTLDPEKFGRSLLAFQKVIQELEKAAYHLERNSNPKILFLDVSLQIGQILKP